VATLVRYLLAIVGFAAVSTRLGIKWANVQWVVAALGVGLGFGLQEIVANLFSGILLLLDGRIRPTHVVTVGDATGRVTSIRALATTITDWNNKELIVPNKEFITGKLINWSLSDKLFRVRVPVGIAYGADTDTAEKLLLKATRLNPLVVREPEPTAFFIGFGDNALNFEVRVFVNGIDNWYPMLHRLNRTIDREFRKAGITIAFPQRDVHLDASGPLEVKVVSADRSSAKDSDKQEAPEK
jgi:potassium efflux system protein